MGAEIEADQLGDEWKGYLLRIAGGNDKQGFPMKQGVLTNSKYLSSIKTLFCSFEGLLVELYTKIPIHTDTVKLQISSP